jgi:predicted Fe-S protein YdhL (DUF1289 family)
LLCCWAASLCGVAMGMRGLLCCWAASLCSVAMSSPCRAHCHTLLHTVACTATRCFAARTAAYRRTLPHTAAHCRTLPHTAVRTAAHCRAHCHTLESNLCTA